MSQEQNPYEAPKEENPQKSRRYKGGPVKWIIATVGALIVTVGAFIGLMLLPVVIYPAIYESVPGLITMYVVCIPLAIAAGVVSFRGTLRQYRIDRD